MTHGLIREPPLTSGDSVTLFCANQVLLGEARLEFLAAAWEVLLSAPRVTLLMATGVTSEWLLGFRKTAR